MFLLIIVKPFQQTLYCLNASNQPNIERTTVLLDYRYISIAVIDL